MIYVIQEAPPEVKSQWTPDTYNIVHYSPVCMLLLFASIKSNGRPQYPLCRLSRPLLSLRQIPQKRVGSKPRHLRKQGVFPLPTFLLRDRTLLLALRRRLRIGGKLQDNRQLSSHLLNLKTCLGNAGCPPLTLYPRYGLSDLIVGDSELGCANFPLDKVLKLQSSRLELV